MKLWGGRFTKETNQLVHNFNASLSFDQKFFEEDIDGSIAHVTMLARQGILTEEDKTAIINIIESNFLMLILFIFFIFFITSKSK